jgi:hypothetical protein
MGGLLPISSSENVPPILQYSTAQEQFFKVKKGKKDNGSKSTREKSKMGEQAEHIYIYIYIYIHISKNKSLNRFYFELTRSTTASQKPQFSLFSAPSYSHRRF